jgi:ketosteroid isomerase-like protein
MREAEMGHREAVLELIRQAYAARGRGDLEGLVAAFHPEAVFTLVGDKRSLQVAGSAQGHHGLRETLGGFIATFKFVERQILSELVEADRAAVHSRLVVRYDPTGKTLTTECLDLLKFQDGKIIELIEFADTALIRDMMSGASESVGKMAN